MRKSLWLGVAVLMWSPAWCDIPATPVMTVYQFNGNVEIPYYDIEKFAKTGPSTPAGSLTQGTSLIPCVAVRNAVALTDAAGTPYVGFRVVVDSRTATRAATERFKEVSAQRQSMAVHNHHCDDSTKHVIEARKLFALKKAPFFDPLPAAEPAQTSRPAQGELDQIVRAFHNSSFCEGANRTLVGRRGALEEAWAAFSRASRGRWPSQAVERAKHLDYVMRTAIFEGHLDRGCNAYGACERNVIALSIRNRARESCQSGQGCKSPGDFQGVSSKVSQYNIWDEYLTQVSGLSSCFLREDLTQGRSSTSAEYYGKLQGIYEQNLADVQSILFGDEEDLKKIFPNHSLADLKALRHYYHAPAMGKCFPDHPRVEYISAAIARKGNNFALIADTRIQVDQPTNGGYFFRDFVFEAQEDRDETRIVDNYPGFVIDGRKVELRPPSRCAPYGIPPGCGFERVGRYRTTPNWLAAGKPLELSCRVKDLGENCQASGSLKTVRVGGICDTQMRPVAGVK